MANGEASTLINVPVCGTGNGTIRLVEDVICARILDGVHFDFDYTFIRPEAKPIIREIVDDINRDSERQVLIAGHTDRVGSNAYNQTLSESRAISVFGYITNQPNVWLDLLRTMLNTGGGPRVTRSGTGQSRDRWQTREIQYMLSYMRDQTTGQHYYQGAIDNVFGPNTQAGLDAFRADNGLPAGGVAGSPRQAGVDEATWQAMFERYIQLDALNVDTSRFLSPEMLGCGENFPRLETRPPGAVNQDLRDADARLETNRRVEFLLIPPALVPSPLTCDNVYQDPDNPVVICPADPQPITITLQFTEGSSNRAMAGLEVQITGQGGFTWQRTTDEQGRIILDEADRTTQGDYRVSVVGNFGLVLRDTSLGEVRGAEVLLHLTRSTMVEIMVTPVPARLNFVENVAPFEQQLDTLDDPLTTTPVEFKLAADIENVTGDEVIVMLSSFLLRGPVSPVPGEGDGGGIVIPATALEFVDASDTPIQQTGLGGRFQLRLDSAEVTGDEVTVMVSSHWFRQGS